MNRRRAHRNLTDTAAGLYVHVPFCETKCGYCDFFSVAVKDRDTAGLVDRIVAEIKTRAERSPHRIETIFCGGGTPTILPSDQLASLLDAINSAVDSGGITEFTVEANPATIDDRKADVLTRHGVTRVSMGAQSFVPDELATLERIHSPDDIAPSVATLRRAGRFQINLDLIFGIPGQTMESWLHSLRRAVELGPDHIACYGLMYEPGTRLTAMKRAGRITPCDEHLEADLYESAIDVLQENGFEPYEISNFAQPGCRCRHNLIYWRNEPYIGVGPSAAGCAGGRRYKNVADVAGYVRMMDAQGHAEVESESIDRETLITEMVMMQLRLVEGLSIDTFQTRIGADPRALFAPALDALVRQRLVTVGDTHLALTRRGRLVADGVMTELLRATSDGRLDTVPGRTTPRPVGLAAAT